MPPLMDSVKIWCQTGKGWYLDLICYGREIVDTNRSHWPAGLMFGLSGAASIFLGSLDIPWMLKYGVFLVFIASAAKYASDYLVEIARYGSYTALILLAITVFIFHGLTSWTAVFTWLPIFVSVTLLTTVNVTPKLAEKFIGIGELFFAISEYLLAFRERERSAERPRYRAMDVEEAEHPPVMAELRGFEYRRQRRTGSLRSYRRCLSEPRDLESLVGTDESIILDDCSVSTTPEIGRVLRRLEPGPSSSPQYITTTNTARMEEHRIYFPEIPQETLLETVPSGNTPTPRILEPPLELSTLA